MKNMITISKITTFCILTLTAFHARGSDASAALEQAAHSSDKPVYAFAALLKEQQANLDENDIAAIKALLTDFKKWEQPKEKTEFEQAAPSSHRPIAANATLLQEQGADLNDENILATLEAKLETAFKSGAEGKFKKVSEQILSECRKTISFDIEAFVTHAGGLYKLIDELDVIELIGLKWHKDTGLSPAAAQAFARVLVAGMMLCDCDGPPNYVEWKEQFKTLKTDPALKAPNAEWKKYLEELKANPNFSTHETQPKELKELLEVCASISTMIAEKEAARNAAAVAWQAASTIPPRNLSSRKNSHEK